MTRDEFLNQLHVRGFVSWLSNHLATVDIHLTIGRSRFVPNAVDTEIIGIDAVLNLYSWSSTWKDDRSGKIVAAENWASTKKSLNELSAWLRNSVEVGDEQAAYMAAVETLRWGGVKGALAFLKTKRDARQLCAYLGNVAPLLRLDLNGNDELITPQVIERFDAGITKIFALLDPTGSPIYDSRVGAALAMLYGLYEEENPGIERLRFPSGAARGQQIRNPGALGYPAAPQFYTAAVSSSTWAKWQLRSGWIIRAVLERSQFFAAEGNIEERSRAFQAALFVLGYDLRCMLPTHADQTPAQTHVRANVAAKSATGQGGNWVPTSHRFRFALKAYLEFRESHPGDRSKETFQNWLKNHQSNPAYNTFANNFQAYSYPFRIPEFGLFHRSLEEIRSIDGGGASGLATAYGDSHFLLGDERENVCLVDVWLAGRTRQMQDATNSRTSLLIGAGIAGTLAAARTLLHVGDSVGKHFDLFSRDSRPTDLFEKFFGSELIDLENRLMAALT